MTKFIDRLNKPEYICRPRQMIKRLLSSVLPKPRTVEVILPWGLRIAVRPVEDIGAAIWRLGLYDLPLSEVIWRLLDPGELGIDCGANVGYVTSLMAARVGPKGRVLSFEPHPKIFAELAANAHLWRSSEIGQIEPLRLGVSDKSGTAFMEEPPSFENNPGLARISEDASSLKIITVSLDEFCRSCGPIGLLKIDVEGHEFEVIKGSQRLIETRQIRDVVFENHSKSFRTASASMLSKCGYTVLAVTRTLTRLKLVSEGERYEPVPYLSANFLATTEPARALSRAQAAGWQTLRPRQSSAT